MGYSSVVGIFSVAIEVAMIILNLLFLYSCGFVKAKREKSEIDDILMSHSACTVCFILFSTPFGLMTYFRQQNDSTAETCAVYQVSAIWYQILCIFVISTLAFNCVGRGYALNNSKFSHRIWSKIITCMVSIFIFFVSLNLAIFPTLGLAPEINNLTDSNVTCHLWITLEPKLPREDIFPIAYLFLGYFNFLCVILCMPITFNYVRKVKRQLCIDLCSHESNFLSERDIIRRRFIDNSRMIALVAGMFYFSWIPNMVMVTLNKAGHVISETAILYAMFGTTMTGLLNPLAYAYWDKAYRNGYKKAMKRVFNLCTCNRLKHDNIPVVVLQTASISKNADSYNPTDGQSPSTNTAVDRSLYDAVNPGCQDELTESNDKTATAEESLVASLTDALTAMTFDQENMDVPDVNESYSLNSESEIFITERQTDILEDDDRLVGRLPKGRSDTSDSSLNSTDNESLEPLDSNDERNLDESIM